MKGSKKLLSLLLSVLMVIGMFPVPGASAETRAADQTWSAGQTIAADKELTITTDPAFHTAENPYTIYVTGAVTLENQINLTGGGYVKVYGDSNNPPR